MTMLAESPLVTHRASPIVSPAVMPVIPRQRTTTTHRAPATTEQLLRQRDRLPANHPERARIRARVIEENLPLAHQLARRYAGRGESVDDLAQVAAVALIKAVDGFDSDRQVPFASYAIPSILGGLKRHFRDTAWGMRVPRATQELAREVAMASSDLSQHLGRAPSTTELARHLGVSPADVRAAASAWQVYHLPSLNAPYVGGGSADVIDIIGGTDPNYSNVDDFLALRPLFAALPPREQRILTMRFFGQMSQSRIAEEVGLSQMHVSRLLRKCLIRLRAEMPL